MAANELMVSFSFIDHECEVIFFFFYELAFIFSVLSFGIYCFQGQDCRCLGQTKACTMSSITDALFMPRAPRFYHNMRIPIVPFGLAIFTAWKKKKR